MDVIAQALHAQPITNLDEVSEGTIIQAICEDGQTRFGMYMRGLDGTARLIPLHTEIPLGPRRAPRKARKPAK